jgi:hypothetical protein
MGRQARASTAIMRRWEPNDPEGSCLLHTIGRYRVLPHDRTDRQNAGALARRGSHPSPYRVRMSNEAVTTFDVELPLGPSIIVTRLRVIRSMIVP